MNFSKVENVFLAACLIYIYQLNTANLFSIPEFFMTTSKIPLPYTHRHSDTDIPTYVHDKVRLSTINKWRFQSTGHEWWQFVSYSVCHWIKELSLHTDHFEECFCRLVVQRFWPEKRTSFGRRIEEIVELPYTWRAGSLRLLWRKRS